MRNLYFLILFFLLYSCSYFPSNNTENNDQSSLDKNEQSINGVYSYSDSSLESVITVSDNSWHGKLVIKSGFGSSYDNFNASYSGGVVRNGVLYDESGYIELGVLSGNTLSMPIGSTRVTHHK